MTFCVPSLCTQDELKSGTQSELPELKHHSSEQFEKEYSAAQVKFKRSKSKGINYKPEKTDP